MEKPWLYELNLVDYIYNNQEAFVFTTTTNTTGWKHIESQKEMT